jgi:hypothetical protein
MLRVVGLAGATMAMAYSFWTFALNGSSEDVRSFARLFVLFGLLGLCAVLPLLLSLRADKLRVPFLRFGRFVEREAPFELSVMLMIIVSLTIAVLPFGRIDEVAQLAGLVLAAVLGVAAATLEHVFPYVTPPEYATVFEDVGRGRRRRAKA